MQKKFFLCVNFVLISILMLTFINPFVIHAEDEKVDFNWLEENIYIADGNEHKYEPVPTKDHIELAYIESTGNQGINTLIPSNTINHYNIDFTYSSGNGNDVIIAGSWTNTTTNSSYLQINHTGSNGGIVFYTGSNSPTGGYHKNTALPANTEYILDSTKNGSISLKVKSTMTDFVTSNTNENFTDPCKFGFFSRGNNTGLLSHFSKYKLHKATIDTDDGVSHIFIPVVTVNDLDASYNADGTNAIPANTVCLYDSGNQKYYLKTGTDDFIAGPPVKTLGDGNKYGILDYIESTGTQIINTQYSPLAADNFVVEMEGNYTSISGNFGLMGALGSSDGSDRYDFGISTSHNNSYAIGKDYSYEGVSSTSTHFDYNNHNFKYVFKEGKMYLDGNLVVNGTGIIKNGRCKFYLFARDYVPGEGTSVVYSNFKMKWCKFYKGDELFMNFIPALRYSDNKPGLYDLENDYFYPNEATSGNDFKYGVSLDFYSIKDSSLDTTHATDKNDYLGVIELTDLGKFFFNDTNLTHEWSIQNNKFISPVNNATYTYDASLHTVSINPTIKNQLGTDITTNAKLLFSNDNGSTYTLLTPPSFKNVGTYTVYYQITPISNPEYYDELTGTATVKINPKEEKISIPNTGVRQH